MIRYSIRTLRRSPLFALVTVVSLGLALAVNTTLFALVDAIAHPYVPYLHPERVVVVFTIGGDKRRPISMEERARAIREGLHSAQSTAEWSVQLTMLAAGSLAEDGRAAAVSPNIFDLLGVRPEVGRGFDTPGLAGQSTQQAIISYRLWNRFFQGRSLDHGLKITVGSATYGVVGVMPRGVHFPFASDVWIPLAAVVPDTSIRTLGPLVVFRLKSGATGEDARRDIEIVTSRLASEYGQSTPYAARLQTLEAGAGSQQGYGEILGIVGVVMLIACANLGTMMLARGMARRRELAIRIAIGAGRRAIVAQVLTECAVIVLAGLVIGFVLMLWALDVVPHVLTPYVPSLGDLRATPSWRVFAFGAVVAMATTLVAGALPAIRAAATDPVEPIKDGGAATDRIRDRYNPLIIVEVALSTGLLMASGLFVLFSMRLAAFQFHYDAKSLIVAQLRVPANLMNDTTAAERFYDDLLERLTGLAHVVAAATRSTDTPDQRVIFAEQGRSGNTWMNSSAYYAVSPGYFRTLGIPMVDGRDFEAGDRRAATGVAIVDEEAARLLWPDDRKPVGHMLKLGDEKSRAPWLRVVGVARRTEFQPRTDLDLPPEPKVYVLYGRDMRRERELVVHGDGVSGYAGRAALSLALRREIQDAAPWMGVPRVQPWLQEYEDRRSSSAFLGSTLAMFGIFGLVLCAVGLYGVLGYSVSRRLREFAIRKTLGARPSDIVRIVVHDTAVTVLAGIGVGAFLGLAGTSRVADKLFVVRYEFAIALVAAEVLLVIAGVAASVGPLRQALRADPAGTLRSS